MLKITNPSTEKVIKEVNKDTKKTIETKYQKSHAALPSWQETPYPDRARAIQKFGSLLAEQREECAQILTTEMGKPITQSNNEIKGLAPRIDFFLEKTPGILETKKVYTDENEPLEEIICYDPLGVIGNISAWNYPYFVGVNVFVPALLTGNTVLYKPSEYSTLTGMKITELLHKAGIETLWDLLLCLFFDG